eukprot:TRINITY_DN7067_c0_g1_i1.p1 TRINITY_DN7067_c0_g1~~TRINITY_DN7067_c0_g1_i1.p1  ORF type:complete len:309 (+),score=88.18 TRINITY_DN7067_c0_g1_i1:173-1099(+)
MWLKPQIHSKAAFWTVLEKNGYFELLRVRSIGSKFVDFPFKIILKGDSTTQYAIAGDTTIENIMKDWNWIQRELLDKNHQQAKKGLNKEDMVAFLLSKFQSLTVDHSDEKTAELRKELRENKQYEDLVSSFTKTFPDLKEEKPVTSFLCYLWKSIPTTGTLFITENYVCFASPLNNKQLRIPFVDITKLEKKSYRTSECVEIYAHDKHYYFTAMNKTEEVYGIVNQIWEFSMKRVWKNAEATLEEIESHYVYQNPQWSKVQFPGGELQQDKLSTVDRIKNKNFQMTFRLPADELILKKKRTETRSQTS